MAMEKHYVIRDTHPAAITALGYSPARREILAGFEDGAICCWEADSGKPGATSFAHKGWITDFLYWTETKCMLSSANDGRIIVWSNGGGIVDKIVVGRPVYCMTINPRRHQLLCAMNAAIRIYDLDSTKASGYHIKQAIVYEAVEHTDIIRCLMCYESRVYSAGYDQKLIIYDSSYTGDKSMTPMTTISNAHDAGITCMLIVKDNENNVWLVTGSFDKSVRIWTMDAKLVHKLDGFFGGVTGICYMPRNRTIWAAAGTSNVSFYDPKSGDNISEFLCSSQTEEEDKYHLQLLKCFPEINQCVASTSRRHLMIWKYNPSGCVTTLHEEKPVESLAYTKKIPILLFSGNNDGVLTKWERLQSNHFMYSQERLLLSEAQHAKKTQKKLREEMAMQELKEKAKAKAHELDKPANKAKKEISGHYAYDPRAYTVNTMGTHKHPNTGVLKLSFVEELDLLLAASEDGNIYAWGFDDSAVSVLKNMVPPDNESNLLRKYSVLLNNKSSLLNKRNRDDDSVTNRVAGFMCKYILALHDGCVTSISVVERKYGHGATYALTGGWDRKIALWNLDIGELVDTFKNPSMSQSHELVEMASDGIITAMAYSPKRNEFAHASSDTMVYIRQFSVKGVQMALMNTLQGHFREVTCVCWNHIMDTWVTGSEDSTVRIWSSEGLNECLQVLCIEGTVSTVCIDKANGAMVVGSQNNIHVFDSSRFALRQSNIGHTDVVRDIIHIPERHQYVSASADKTVRIWNAWKVPTKSKRATENARKTKSLFDIEQLRKSAISYDDTNTELTDEKSDSLKESVSEIS